MEVPYSVIKQITNTEWLFVYCGVLTIYWGGNGDMSHNTGVIASPHWGEGVVHRGDMGAGGPSQHTINTTLSYLSIISQKIFKFMIENCIF